LQSRVRWRTVRETTNFFAAKALIKHAQRHSKIEAFPSGLGELHSGITA
jgi:hypothetical protein